MKGFLYKLLVFGAIALLTHVIAGYHMNGDTDTNYLRFTPNKNTGLILGNSRAAQAICPDDITSHEGLFNAGFSLNTSPYGEIYQAFLIKHINQENKNQFFVFCVDPWSLSSPVDSISGDDVRVERDKFVATTRSIAYPNWEFIIEQYPYGWGNIIKEHYRPTSGMHLHRNGWLEINRVYDDTRSSQRRALKIQSYRNDVFVNHHPSDYRKAVLRGMIREMSKLGKVMLVRIPTHPDFFELEHEFWPTFEQEMDKLSKDEEVFFWSPKELNEQLIFNDGHHMNYMSSHRFSGLLNEKIAAVKR